MGVRRERVKVDIEGMELKLSAYLGFVESDPRYPFYTYTVGDTSGIFYDMYVATSVLPEGIATFASS